MGKSYGEVHVFGCMMSGMQAPQQTYFMGKVMIYKMSQFPDDIAIDEPIPGEACIYNRELFKESDAKSHCSYGNEAGDKPVEDMNKKDHLVIGYSEFFVNQCPDDFYNEEKGNQRSNGRHNSFISPQ
jgi:hypothetical protein